MLIVQLMASPFLGGPERQVLGLAQSLRPTHETVFLSFAERGLCRPFLEEARRLGFAAEELKHNAPHVRAAAREIADHLQRLRADVLCCNGYKPDVLGWLAARQAGVPVVSISHGWTAATLKVRLYETLDRWVLRWMDYVVCVSEGQAQKVRRAGVPAERVTVIRNGIHVAERSEPDPAYRHLLRSYFDRPPARIVGAAGRLSPEKGFRHFVEAAALLHAEPETGFVLFGDGPLREDLQADITARGLQERFVLAGFRKDLERFLPHLSAVVLPSYTEGLPVILLEALAAGVPVVATAVGGTPEVVEDGVNGYLVSPRDSVTLAERIRDVLASKERRSAMGARGRQRVLEQFTFERMGSEYRQLFDHLLRARRRRAA